MTLFGRTQATHFIFSGLTYRADFRPWYGVFSPGWVKKHHTKELKYHEPGGV